jgi:hypothetical protein
MEQATLGNLIDADRVGRDAIHMAIAPGVAAEELYPGQHVGFAEPGNLRRFGPGGPHVGIVDPFLRGPVPVGAGFYVCLYPNTVTSLRHVWQHPAFVVRPPAEKGASRG